MSIDRTYYCDGPDCGGDGGLKGGASSVHAQTATPPPHLPGGFLELRGDRTETAHFCSWDCLMKYAASHPADEVIPITEEDEQDAG
jgi:hypothetical protein